MRKIVVPILLAALLGFAQGASAQAFPSKPIRLIVPFPAGLGALELLSRGISQRVSESIGQPVLVENRVGASGAIGAEAVARSAPDGYTMLMGTTTTHGINPALNPKLSYNALTDFTPISLVGTEPLVLIVNSSVPANTLQEFIRLAKAKPGMSFGSAGNGTPHHLAAETLKSMAGIDVLHVPYKGAVPALTDLVGGRLQFMMYSLAAAQPHVKAGKVRQLAIATPQRVPGVDLPTFAESGYPGFEFISWYAIFGPAGMPEAVVSRLNAEIVKALRSEELRERMRQQSITVVGSSPAELGAYLRTDLARWKDVVKTTGVKLE
jgi:tripartite-type tricarboxylate transporter receptor subunit TctC